MKPEDLTQPGRYIYTDTVMRSPPEPVEVLAVDGHLFVRFEGMASDDELLPAKLLAGDFERPAT